MEERNETLEEKTTVRRRLKWLVAVYLSMWFSLPMWNCGRVLSYDLTAKKSKIVEIQLVRTPEGGTTYPNGNHYTIFGFDEDADGELDMVIKQYPLGGLWQAAHGTTTYYYKRGDNEFKVLKEYLE